MVGDFSPNALLHTDLYSIRHNEYYVKSRKQGSNLRPEIYKIPALSLSYSGKAPQPRFERGTAKLTVLSSTTELLGNGLENKSPTGTPGIEPGTQF